MIWNEESPWAVLCPQDLQLGGLAWQFSGGLASFGGDGSHCKRSSLFGLFIGDEEKSFIKLTPDGVSVRTLPPEHHQVDERAEAENGANTWGQCYKNFFVRILRIFVQSWSIY
jgi:hypothetical protein